MLSSGGLLLVSERYPDWSIDFLEGLNPAWWHEDQQGCGEPFSSLRAPEAWQQILRSAASVHAGLTGACRRSGLDEGGLFAARHLA